MRHLIVASVGLLLATTPVAFAGCDRGEGGGSAAPDTAFRQFLMHWFKDERQKAFESIDPRDRETLTRPLAELRRSLDPESLPKPSEMLVAGRVDNPYDLKEVDVVERPDGRPSGGDRAQLTLKYQDGRTAAATMVYREGAWYVDLPLKGASLPGRNAATRSTDAASGSAGSSDAADEPMAGDADSPSDSGHDPTSTDD